MGKRTTQDEVIKDFKDVHGDVYDYSYIKYTEYNVKVCVLCKQHGEFWVTPNNHKSKKSGCPKCKAEKARNHSKYTKDDFIRLGNLKHNNK